MRDGKDEEERRRRLREQPVAAVEPRGDAVVVRLGGELDLYNAPVVKERLLALCARAPERLVLDLSEVEFIDSTALGALLAARAALPDGRPLLIAAASTETRRTLQVAGLDRHLPVHDTVESALAADL